MQHRNDDCNRRRWLTSAVAATATSIISCRTTASDKAPAPKAPERGSPGRVHPLGEVPVKPLPFDPTKLSGLSERLLVSHHENNYTGAVKKLNAVEAKLEQLKENEPGFILGALHDKRLAFENSVILHELYFANLGGDGQLGPELKSSLVEQFGTLGAWEHRFESVGKSLGGGSGWALLTYHLHRRALSIDIAQDHTQTCANSVVLLALDMYEHSYHMDFGTAAARYIDAFLANVHGEVVEQRFRRAQKLGELYA